MKRLVFLASFGVLLIFAAGCGTAPEVTAAHAKQQEALINVRQNLTVFAEAALKDLQGALFTQIDREFALRRAALIDAEGKVLVADYDKELTAAAEARERDRAKVLAQVDKFRWIMQDLDGAIEVGVALDRYLNRPLFTKEDAVALMKEIADILKTGGE